MLSVPVLGLGSDELLHVVQSLEGAVGLVVVHELSALEVVVSALLNRLKLASHLLQLNDFVLQRDQVVSVHALGHLYVVVLVLHQSVQLSYSLV